MRSAHGATAALVVLVFAATEAMAQLPRFRPGFNLFSKDQDVRLGKEAAGEIEKQAEVVDNKELTAYIASIGKKLAEQPQAENYPYTFKVVNDKSINAFALPGGPAFVNTGLIAAVDNEAQLAGVLAHEIVHVALRHGTNQASKANLIQLPALLAGKSVGGGILGQLGQLGIGLGANSVLMKFSRTAETQADLLGAQIAAQAGYNPIEMARFFEKLESAGGSRGPRFLSDHPNPGNRMKAIEDMVQNLPRRSYTADSGQLPRMKAIVAGLPAPKPRTQPQAEATSAAAGAAPTIVNSRPSGRLQAYQGKDFRISYPDNWSAAANQGATSVTLAPPAGVLKTQNGQSVGYGAILAYYQPKSAGASLWQATEELVAQLRANNPKMRAGSQMPKQIRVGGKDAILTALYTDSIFQGQTELDQLVTVAHPNGIFYMVLIAPDSERQYVDKALDQMLQSLEFSF